MAVHEIQGTQQTQPIERVVEQRIAGKVISVSVFKDVNSDGVEDLYSFTRNHYDANGNFTDSVTYKDFDGDGLCNSKTTEKADGRISGGSATEMRSKTVTEAQKRNFNNLSKLQQVNQSRFSQEQLLAYGFEKSDIMDMNGGVYYTNKKTGEKVRMDSMRTYSYTKGNVTHEQYLTRSEGKITVDYGEGNIKHYFYKLDENGNKVLTNILEEKTPKMADVSREITNIKKF